ncbi:acid protease [Imleria badia]|nr:acid protease [Imleria badia]
MDSIRLKYGYTPVNKKRSTTYAPLTDEANDSSYSAVVSIGTPAQEFNLILDTGSSDLWVATNQCTACTTDVPLFNPSKSSSYKNGSSSLQITYGSGNVGGYVSADTVSFSGFTIANQELLSVAVTSDGLLDDQLSGIMGLGFETLSALQTTPFWQTLLSQNKLSSPVFSFYLERYVNQAAMNEAPGGTFTLGGTNTSLYSGNIEFINMPTGTTPSYWLQQVQSVTVQGKSISISSSQGLAAIDTGTTLIGAPSAITKEIWSNVPGSVALTGQFAGMYAFPCSTSISVSLSFGGTHWPVSAADMNLGAVSGIGSNQMCGGAIFDIGNTVGGSGANVPTWIVGDTFLKNVYTVFQGNPAAVGFAQLASGLSSDTSPGSNPISITGSAGIPVPSGLGSGASPTMIVSTSLSLVVALLSGFLITL